MDEPLRWSEVEQKLDDIERWDWPRIVPVFLEYVGRLLDPRDTGGRRKFVTIGSFCSHFKLSRYLFEQWLDSHHTKETA